MILTSPIQFDGIHNTVQNIEYYKDIFLKDGLLVFRDANLSPKEHVRFHSLLSNKFKFYTKEGSYTENHNHNAEIGKAGNNEILLSWHLEHVHYSNPIVIATWNMYKFTTDFKNGNTYFVDMEKFFTKLTTDTQEFLKKCVIFSPPSPASNNKMISSYLVQKHWIHNNPVLRICFPQNFDKDINWLKSFDGRVPTSAEINNYKIIINDIKNTIKNDDETRIVHQWKQGDLLIPDMFKMCHAVTGGFDPKDREFTGIWGFKDVDSSTI